MVVNCAAMALHDRAGTELMDQHHAVGLQNGEEFVLIINQQTGTRTKAFLGHFVVTHLLARQLCREINYWFNFRTIIDSFRELEHRYNIPPDILDERWSRRFIRGNFKVRVCTTMGLIWKEYCLKFTTLPPNLSEHELITFFA